jgi:hypothetical protein
MDNEGENPKHDDGENDGEERDDDILRQPVKRPPTPGTYDAGNMLSAVAVTFILSWLLLAVVVMGSNSGMAARYVAAGMVVVALAVLVPKRTRQAGGGALLGMVVGIILGSGTCTAMVGTGCVLC